MRTPAAMRVCPRLPTSRRRFTGGKGSGTPHGTRTTPPRTIATPAMPSATPPAVRFRAAVAVLGRFPALAGVDLDVDAGEIVLVQGPNGAGKTSLLRACAGL